MDPRFTYWLAERRFNLQVSLQDRAQNKRVRGATNRPSRSRRFLARCFRVLSCGSTRKRKRYPLPQTLLSSAIRFLRRPSTIAREIQFDRRKLTRARARARRSGVDFQFSKFKEMIPPILSPASETAPLASSPPRSHRPLLLVLISVSSPSPSLSLSLSHLVRRENLF